ncbi:zinc finger MYM-type protein 1-like [Belonocnema kinseyi]|uniref:zinc finger MYM-type protein 1-like n=1 Tax=Belonocnema kinseyi TaxID=2817044 RepID=UPI00143DE94E|nr:zinc finger MYM-type protein 1-like [Belonocnema kinseyi]
MHDLLVNVWTPDADFVFPATEINKKILRFQFSWLQKYPWLIYSAVEDGAYCRVCILFAQKIVGKGKHERFNSLVQPCVKDWKRALERFKDHQTKRYRLDASDDAQNFKLIYENKRNDFIIEIDQSRKWLQIENRRKLTSIIRAVLFCCRQGLAQRGRRDDGPLPLDIPEENDGNFRALWRFAVDIGDLALQEHLKVAGSNATYLSHTVQNEIIDAGAEIITRDCKRPA